jgi:hypothetical protein
MNARLDVRKAGELSTDANKMVLVFHKAEVVGEKFCHRHK